MSLVLEIPVTLYETKVFSIDSNHLSFHDLQMDIKDITGFCYGRIINTSAGLPTDGSHHYKFEDSSGDLIGFGFLDSVLINAKKNAELATALEYAIWEYLGNGLLNRIVREIHEGKDVKIGAVVLHRSGIHVSNPSNMRRPEFTVPWEYAFATAHNGDLLISSALRGDDSCAMPLRTTLNAHVLHRILLYSRTNPYLCDVLRGLQPPLA